MKKYSYYGHRGIDHPNGNSGEHWLAYTCANCNNQVTGAVVASRKPSSQPPQIHWMQCPTCGSGSVWHHDTGVVEPTAKEGEPIQGLPELLESAYEEARASYSAQAYTACELICRNILMYAAVDKEAKKKLTFNQSIEYLEERGFVTPPMSPWVKAIKDNGNKAAHELEMPDQERAKSTLMFTAKLLEMIYQMEYLAQEYVPEKVEDESGETDSEE